MSTKDKCDLTISEEQIGNAKAASPEVLEALCVQAKAVIDAGGTICITRANAIIKRITTPADIAAFCATIMSY